MVTTGMENELNDDDSPPEGVIFERLVVLLPRDMKSWLMNPAKHHGEKGSTVIRSLIREKMESEKQPIEG